MTVLLFHSGRLRSCIAVSQKRIAGPPAFSLLNFRIAREPRSRIVDLHVRTTTFEDRRRTSNFPDTMTDIEQSFNRYFATLPATDPLCGAHVLDLHAAHAEPVRSLAKAFIDIKAEINQRFVTNALDIVAPTGVVQVHMDYIASSEVNAFVFQFEDWYFIGLTEGMVELFAKSCSDLWRLNALGDLLGVELTNDKRDLLFQFVLLLELQYISNHELGHLFHGHCADLSAGRCRAEFSVESLLAESVGMEQQAKELEADGYSVNLLLKNLLQIQSGSFMHQRVQSNLPLREFVLTLFVLSVATVLYYLESTTFNPSEVRRATHSDGLVRMNILMGEILGWCTDNVGWPNAISWADFQRIMSLVVTAASTSAQEQIWKEQGAYLQTDEGKAYLADIYKRRINLRNKMTPHHWRLRTEGQEPAGE